MANPKTVGAIRRVELTLTVAAYCTDDRDLNSVVVSTALAYLNRDEVCDGRIPPEHMVAYAAPNLDVMLTAKIVETQK